MTSPDATAEEPSNTTMESIRSAMKSVRVPTAHSRVFNDECSFSFDTPESPDGLYTSLNTWQSFGENYVGLDHERTGNVLYLHQKWWRIPKEEEEVQMNGTAGNNKPTKLAIGVPGGFDVDKKEYDLEKKNAIVLMPGKAKVPFPSLGLPSIITMSVEAILEHKGFAKSQAIAAYEEKDDRKESKYARNLEQLDTGKKISPDPKTWKCEESGQTENLWLNLSTGFIGSGRRNWDGSGGTGASLHHFENTGIKYPLCVKLGTITPHGADVYSYAPDENDMVIDPLLSEHLSHWGINMQSQVQTSKTMMEMQIELNTTYEFNAITEAGASLKPISGPGYIGLDNLGNSCYMNSLFQIFASLPAFQSLYYGQADSIFRSAPEAPASDVVTMIAKLFCGLLSDRYAKKEQAESESNDTENPIQSGHVRPAMLKAAVAKSHPEFSSGRQQDVAEYFQYMLDTIAPAERSALGKRFQTFSLENGNSKRAMEETNMEIDGGQENGDPKGDGKTKTECLPFDFFRFAVEDRIECKQSNGVLYKIIQENILELPIPMSEAVEDQKAQGGDTETDATQASKKMKASLNDEVRDKGDEKEVKLKVPFDACLNFYFGVQEVEGFLSPVTGKRGIAEKAVRLQTFPEYLVVCLRRYYVAEDWTPKKLDVRVEVPEKLDLSGRRAKGIQDGEVLLKEREPSEGEVEVEAASLNSAPEIDPSVIQQIVAMGFSENGAKRAIVTTGNCGVESALQWVFSHSEDADFNDPLQELSTATESGSRACVDPAGVNALEGMGFPKAHAIAALKECNGDVARATDWLFSNSGNIEEVIKKQAETEKASSTSATGDAGHDEEHSLDGIGKYTLVGFASHMGKNTGCGHYVAHIKKEGRFVLFNDEKVAISQAPPNNLGYLYVYKRDPSA